MADDISSNLVNTRGNQILLWPTNGTHAPPTVRPHVAHNSGEQEWYTPPAILQAARQVLGTIDLDPASTPAANTLVQATRFYTRADNGLRQHWYGTVWLNPPYASGLIDPFLAKLRYHLDTGDVSAAMVLVNNATETRWFATLAAVASAVCFPVGRVRYLSTRGVLRTPLQGQALLYCGPHPDVFTWHCRSFGHVWLALPGRPVSPQRPLLTKESP